ncbi:cytochrome c biogenesis protein [Campylobacter sp. MG1]|uniref:cytochrome c biogenesis protein n=1 Tax=Campylobacter sp. MG1 TaxID=2976332 RepID=UPI00226C7D3B|nr:cytochrome c biogenesis protein CcsA [Campylobacter sp. MG1]
MKLINKKNNLSLALFFMLIFAIMCACATLVEAKYGVQKAKDLFYNAWYFYLVMIILFINLIISIFQYKIYKKISLFLIHISFIFIFVGAVLTHFYGFEGVLNLREGEFKDEILSANTSIKIIKDNKEYKVDNFNDDLIYDGGILRFVEFSNEAKEEYVSSDNINDKSIIKLNFTYENELYNLELNEYDCNLVKDLNFCFNKVDGDKYVNFNIKNNEFYASTNVNMKRIYQGKEEYLSDDFKFIDGVYYYEDFTFNPILTLTHAKNGYVMSGGDLKAIKVSLNGKDLILPLNKDILYEDMKISWSQDSLKLGYNVYLKKFNLFTYPASNTPKDYESEILIIDNNEKIHASISMNNVLDYKGFRFFQHSYDDDLRGTVLSVNKDLGKIPTYIGYFVLFLGCFLNLFSKHTKTLFKMLSLLLCLFTPKIYADDVNSHLNELNTVVTQDLNGRFLSFYALTNDLCNKLKCPKNLKANEEIFKLITDISYVNEAKLIKVDNDKLKKELNLSDNYAKFSDFYDGPSYKLKDILKQTYAKGEANFSEYDKELIKVDERVNIFYLIFTGELFKIIPEMPDFRLVSPFSDNLNLQNQNIANKYISSLLLAKSTKDYKTANENLNEIKKMQNSYNILPSNNQIIIENFLVKIDAFYLLLKIYCILFLLSLVLIFKNNKIIWYLTFFTFILHLVLLCLRGFVAGFTPLTNTYESLIYIALSSVFAGLVFRKNLLLSLCLLFSVATLFTAHLNDINPQITNLMPVLNSPYLSIHVSLIAASYGFFGLSALISFSYLLCVIFKKPYDKANIQIYLANHLGLLLLICGNFLGGIWANESWGRYWGWDSKETWSLISILIYAILVHLKLKSKLLYALLSMWGFGVILMTYFGVNYYLVGKHSYAGEKSNFESPLWLIISVIILIIFSLVAIRRNLK